MRHYGAAMTPEPSGDDARGIVAYSLFLLGAVIVGPLEAALGLACYWLLYRR